MAFADMTVSAERLWHVPTKQRREAWVLGGYDRSLMNGCKYTQWMGQSIHAVICHVKRETRIVRIGDSSSDSPDHP